MSGSTKWTVRDDELRDDRRRYSYSRNFVNKLDDLLATLSFEPRPEEARRQHREIVTLPEGYAPPARGIARVMRNIRTIPKILSGLEKVRKETWEIEFRPFRLDYALYDGFYRLSRVRLIVPLMITRLDMITVDENTPGLKDMDPNRE